jgi:DNA-binding transcriptional LysR family regulator
LEEIDNAVKDAAIAGRGADGSVRLGIVSSISHGFVRELIQRFRAAHPGVGVDLVEGPQHRHVLEVGERQLDAAILVEGWAVPGCESLSLWRSQVFVVLPQSHPLAGRESLHWDDLRAETFIVTNFSPGPETQSRIIARLAGPHCNPVVTRYEIYRDTMLQMVALGFGITLVSEGAIEAHIPGLVFRPLASEEDCLSYTAIWLAENDNPALRRLLSLARSMAKTWPKV